MKAMKNLIAKARSLFFLVAKFDVFLAFGVVVAVVVFGWRWTKEFNDRA